VQDSTPPPIAGRSGPAPLPHVGEREAARSGGDGPAARITPPEGSPRLPPGEEERRRHPRAPVDLLVGLKFESLQQFLAVYAEDLSESGMFLRSEHAGPLREVGQTVELRFDAGNRRIVEGRARVVRLIEPSAPGAPGGIAIEFIDLDPVSRKLIEAIVRIKLAAVRGG
jgi:PilZ domain